MVRFQAVAPHGAVRLGADGRAFVPTSSGQSLYLETAAPTAAVHGNPGFEDQTAGIPDVWDFFWESGDTEYESEVDVVYSGQRSLRVHIEAGGGFQVVLSDTFDVASGDRVDFSTFAVKDEGSPVIQRGILTGASGDPVFLDPTNFTNNEDQPTVVTDAWERYGRQAVVPGGHTKGRLFFRIAPDAAEAVTVYLDLTTSALTAAPVKDSGWIALPFAADWADTGFGWQSCQYRRLGDDLFLRGLAARSTSASGATATIATLPVEFRPIAANNPIGDAYLTSASLPTPTQLYLTSAGAVVTTESIPAGAFVPFQAQVSLL